jgi:hypothetical protein
MGMTVVDPVMVISAAAAGADIISVVMIKTISKTITLQLK